MTQRADDWVDKYGWHIVTGLASILGAWITLRAQVTELENKKLDKTVYENDRGHYAMTLDSVLRVLIEIKYESHQTHAYICHNKAEMVGCQP